MDRKPPSKTRVPPKIQNCAAGFCSALLQYWWNCFGIQLAVYEQGCFCFGTESNSTEMKCLCISIQEDCFLGWRSCSVPDTAPTNHMQKEWPKVGFTFCLFIKLKYPGKTEFCAMPTICIYWFTTSRPLSHAKNKAHVEVSKTKAGLWTPQCINVCFCTQMWLVTCFCLPMQIALYN